MLGLGLNKVKGLGDRDILEGTDFSRLWLPKKLKLNWLAKGMGSDTFIICDEMIQQTHEWVS